MNQDLSKDFNLKYNIAYKALKRGDFNFTMIDGLECAQYQDIKLFKQTKESSVFIKIDLNLYNYKHANHIYIRNQKTSELSLKSLLEKIKNDLNFLDQNKKNINILLNYIFLESNLNSFLIPQAEIISWHENQTDLNKKKALKILINWLDLGNRFSDNKDYNTFFKIHKKYISQQEFLFFEKTAITNHQKLEIIEKGEKLINANLISYEE